MALWHCWLNVLLLAPARAASYKPRVRCQIVFFIVLPMERTDCSLVVILRPSFLRICDHAQIVPTPSSPSVIHLQGIIMCAASHPNFVTLPPPFIFKLCAHYLLPSRPLPDNIIALSWRRSTWSIVNRITSTLWLICARGLLQFNTTLLSAIPMMSTIISIVAVECIASGLVVDRRAVRRSWGATVVRLIWVITVLSILSIVVLRSRHPTCAVHGGSSSEAATAVVETSASVRRQPLGEKT